MAKLLHVVASPRGNRSDSITVAQHFIEPYLATHPGDTVETLDLWQAGLPEFDGETIDAKYAVLHGQKHTPEQRPARHRSRPEVKCTRLASARRHC
jgi:FMN-dependent NADH-azoreductase